MLLYLVRHGETDWNLERRIQGSTDISLNATGREQAAATGALLARRTWDAVIASPLSRAFETASIIAAAVGLPAPAADPALVERNYGAAEGLTDRQIDEQYPADAPVPGRETRDAVVLRVLPALMRIAETHPGQSVIVVSHGGVIRSVLNAIDPNNQHGVISNGSVHSIRHDEGSFRLIAFDDPIDDESLACATADLDEQNGLERREAAGREA
ncbi:MAG: histidine phosphatase family protein [Rhodoglobus sp.]